MLVISNQKGQLYFCNLLIKFVCDSNQRLAKDMVEDACEVGQSFVKGALRVLRLRVLPELLVRASLLRFATVYRVSLDPHLIRFFLLATLAL